MRCTSHVIGPIIALAISFTTVAAQPHRGSDLRTTFTARETAMWENARKRDTTLFATAIGDGYVGVYDAGISGRAEEMKGVSTLALKSYRLDSVQVRRIDASNVLMTYRTTVDGESAGKSITGRYNTMSLWHRTRGRWYTIAHTEVKAP